MILIFQQAGIISIKGIHIHIYTVQLCTKEVKKLDIIIGGVFLFT